MDDEGRRTTTQDRWTTDASPRHQLIGPKGVWLSEEQDPEQVQAVGQLGEKNNIMDDIISKSWSHSREWHRVTKKLNYVIPRLPLKVLGISNSCVQLDKLKSKL